MSITILMKMVDDEEAYESNNKTMKMVEDEEAYESNSKTQTILSISRDE